MNPHCPLGTQKSSNPRRRRRRHRHQRANKAY
uniref:Uncharacterized protein n=1 Tax=Rhizophora mucronata TaxID=61149 RepID=A0A2P2IXS1_RHIMU